MRSLLKPTFTSSIHPDTQESLPNVSPSVLPVPRWFGLLSPASEFTCSFIRQHIRQLGPLYLSWREPPSLTVLINSISSYWSYLLYTYLSLNVYVVVDFMHEYKKLFLAVVEHLPFLTPSPSFILLRVGRLTLHPPPLWLHRRAFLPSGFWLGLTNERHRLGTWFYSCHSLPAGSLWLGSVSLMQATAPV